MRKVLALLLSVVMALSLMVTTAWAEPVEQDLAGKTVILHTNPMMCTAKSPGTPR